MTEQVFYEFNINSVIHFTLTEFGAKIYLTIELDHVYYNIQSMLNTMEQSIYFGLVEELQDLIDNRYKRNKYKFPLLDSWEDVLPYRDKFPKHALKFDMVDLLCNNVQDIDLEKCYDISEIMNTIYEKTYDSNGCLKNDYDSEMAIPWGAKKLNMSEDELQTCLLELSFVRHSNNIYREENWRKDHKKDIKQMWRKFSE